MSVTLRRRKTRNGDTLYLDIYSDGQRRRESLNLTLNGDRVANKAKLRLAEIRRAQVEIELDSNRLGIVTASNKNRNFVKYFSDIAEGKQEVGHNWHSTALHLRNYAGEHFPFQDVTEEWLEGLKRFFVESFSRNTAHTYFSKVKSALRQAVRDRIIHRNPAEFVKQISREEVPRTHLTVDEVEIMASSRCPDPELRRAFLFGCVTGLRVSDIRGLLWKNIVDDRIEFRQQKTGRFEYMPLTKEAKELLGMPGDRENFVFSVPSDGRVSILMRRWTKMAGIEKSVTFHSSRHTFATLLLTYGTDLATIQSMLGHQSIRTTQIYAKIVDSKKQAAVDRFPSIEIGVRNE